MFFENVPSGNPQDYVYSTEVCNDCGECFQACTFPYKDAPSRAYFTTGRSGKFNIYLLDPYPSSTLTNQLFNPPAASCPPPAGSSPGLGIFKPQLFQRFRGWEFNQVKPVNWPGAYGCQVG